MFRRIGRDIQAVFDRDPAARSAIEVLLCYSGVHALIFHRVAHWLWGHGMHLMARCMSQTARRITGIEIHPAATLGEGVFIDHGMGVVIGETSEVGDNVTLYQGVTLGGTGKEKGKRHPTIGDNVVVGVGAKVLGNITVGDGAVIGGGAVVLKPVPADATAVGVPARVVRQHGRRIQPLEHGKLPDPYDEIVNALVQRIERLEGRLAEIEGRSHGSLPVGDSDPQC